MHTLFSGPPSKIFFLLPALSNQNNPPSIPSFFQQIHKNRLTDAEDRRFNVTCAVENFQPISYSGVIV